MALSASLEAPALRTLSLVGADTFQERLRALELEGAKRSADQRHSTSAPGTVQVSLGALTNAYRALANGGEWRSWRLMPEQSGSTPRRVMRADASFVVADILAERNTRALLFGAQHPLASRIWVAVKTGTSPDLRSGWSVGFSERYTVGVWAGSRADAAPHEAAVSAAATIWREVMDHLHRQGASTPPPIPEGVLSRAVSFEPAPEAARSELFLAGTQTPRVARCPGAAAHRLPGRPHDHRPRCGSSGIAPAHPLCLEPGGR
jgi:penicillin-binding protein 1C